MSTLSQTVDGPFELLCKNMEDAGTVMNAKQVTRFDSLKGDEVTKACRG